MGRVRYNVALVLANVLFGANFSFYVSLTRYYFTFQQIFIMQVATAAAFFIPFAIFSSRSYRITVEDFGNIFIVALLVIYGWMYMLVWGASCTSPIDASTISTLGPVFTLFVARVVTPKSISWLRIAGAVIALTGAAVFLFDGGESLVGNTREGFGNALVLCAVVAIAANTVLIRPQLQRYSPAVVMGWYYIIGCAIAAPFFWREISGINPLLLPLGALFELMYVLVLGTVLPMWLLYFGTEHLTSIHTALYRYIQPVVAIALSLLRGQSKIDRANVVGAILIFTGIVLVAGGGALFNRLVASRRSRPPTRE